MRVRDELEMTMDAYRLIYESGIGLRKPSQYKLDNARKDVIELEVLKQKINNDLEIAIARYKKTQRQGNEQLKAGQQKHDEEMNFINRSNQQIKVLIEGINYRTKILD